MEGILKQKPTLRSALLSPASNGWRVSRPEGLTDNWNVQTINSLEEAVLTVPFDQSIHLALPYSHVLVERLKLPTLDPIELNDMLRLQLEKTLPYSIEEISSDFEIIEQTETETTLSVIAINNEQIEAFCEPLRNHSRLPSKITLFAMHVAAGCPETQNVFVIYKEDEKFILAICQKAKLIYAQIIEAATPTTIVNELPQMILSAEMEGISTAFSLIFLDQVCIDLKNAVGDFFGIVPEIISLDNSLPEPSGNLIPQAWHQERKRLKNAARLKTRLLISGIVYFIMVVCAFGFQFWTAHKVTKIDRQLTLLQPGVDFVQKRRDRWKALEPAVDQKRYTVELLYQIFQSMSSEDLRITKFEQKPDQLLIAGEGPSFELAIDFGNKLKSNPNLNYFKFDDSPPKRLPNQRWKFQFFGKI